MVYNVCVISDTEQGSAGVILLGTAEWDDESTRWGNIMHIHWLKNMTSGIDMQYNVIV